MLPDYPEIKRRLYELYLEEMKAVKAKELGFIGKIPCSIAFEGDRTIIKRHDGSVQESIYKDLGTPIKFTKDELENSTPKDIQEKMNEAATTIAENQAKNTFAVMSEELSKTGNVIDAKGAKFSVDLYLSAIEKIQIDFDHKTGMPKLPTMVVPPDFYEKTDAELKKIQTQPELKERFEKLLKTKREEWIARESNRKLVG